MPDWPRGVVGDHVRRCTERTSILPDVLYDTMGVRWYGKGAYLRPPSRPRTKTLGTAREGNFVFCRIDVQNGPFAIVPGHLDGALVSNEFPLYQVESRALDARFLLLCFSAPRTLELIGKSREGRDGRARWKEADFETWAIPLPPMDVQIKVVDVVASMDGVISGLDREVTAANTARAALLDRLIQNLGGDVEHLHLRDVASWSSGGTPKADNAKFYSGDIPWAIIGDVRGRTVVRTTRQLTTAGLDAIGGVRKLVPAGTVLVTMYGTIGQTAITGTQMATNQAICRGLPFERVSADYLRLWISARRSDLILLGDGNTQQNISKAKIEAFPIKVPSLGRQSEIVEVMTTVDDQIEALEHELDRATKARNALLTALLDRTVAMAPTQHLGE